MKKLLALILAITLMATMSVTAFATDVTTDGGTGDTLVSFSVSPAYTVTIPATVTLEKKDAEGVITYENDYTITAEAGVRLNKGETIVVTVASDYVMETAQGATLPYTITLGGAALENNVVATFTTATAPQSSTIHIAADDPWFAGEYKDTVTFTIAVVSAPSAPATISFTIDGVAYEADVGMTWAQWVLSDYNNGGFALDSYGGPMVWSGHNAVCCPGAADAWTDYIDSATEIKSGLAYTLLLMAG